VINTESGNTLTYANNGLSFSGVDVNFDTETYQERPWWKFWGSAYTYQVVSAIPSSPAFRAWCTTP